ncbi:hypothetical protein IJ00_18155 [Calothrix sp. 336/3]|nr:hypothetical protein IJ00_18155 [Calothrix sp. 336/3]
MIHTDNYCRRNPPTDVTFLNYWGNCLEQSSPIAVPSTDKMAAYSQSLKKGKGFAKKICLRNCKNKLCLSLVQHDFSFPSGDLSGEQG